MNKKCRVCKTGLTEATWNAGSRRRNNMICKTCDVAKSREWQTSNPEKVLFNNKRHNAKRAGVEFSIEIGEITWPRVCPVLGLPLDYTRQRTRTGGPLPASPSFDRRDPAKGYVSGNVIIVSNRANTIKHNASPDEILAVGQFYKKLQEGDKQ